MDVEAIARLKRGEIGGLEALVHLYQVQAFDAAYLITHDRVLAEDVVQAAFLCAYERIHQLHDARSFRAWFLRSVVNGALSAAKSSTRSPLSIEAHGEEALELPTREPGVEEMIEVAETREEIWALLEALSPNQRAAVVMRYYFDWNDAEVARKLEIPAGTVRRRLHDAKQRLRQLLLSRAI